jgi:hypothetical protein
MTEHLARYDEMRRAIAACVRLDEVKRIYDTASALHAAAQRAARDSEAERKARDIRLRAARKAGELLREIPRDGPAEAVRRRHDPTVATLATVSDYRRALKDAGVPQRDANRWQELAAVPAELFEAEVASGKGTERSIIEKAKPRQAQAAQPPETKPAQPEPDDAAAGCKRLAETYNRFARAWAAEREAVRREFAKSFPPEMFREEIERRLAVAKKRHEEAHDKYRRELKLYQERNKRLDEWMTEAEFKLVLGCLHPDRPSRDPEALNKAFVIMKRLEARLSPHKRDRKRHGWN